MGTREKPISVKFSFYISKGQQSDLDNLISSGLDLLQKGGVIENDRWCVDFDGTRLYYKQSAVDYTVVTIKEASEHEVRNGC